MVRLLIFLAALLPWDGQATAPVSSGAGPVQDVTKPQHASDVSLLRFDFQEVTFLHAGPGLFRIDGQPVKGMRYPVEGSLYWAEAIASVRFQLVDTAGKPIEWISMARVGTPRDSRFIGMVTVPEQPFRVVATGIAVDGKPFTTRNDRLFNPVDRSPSRPAILEGMSSSDARLMTEMMDAAGPRLIAEIEAELAKNPSETIVVPRMKLGNVTYEPLLSAQGGVIGLRIAYEATFSVRGEYDPALEVHARYEGEGEAAGRMHVINSSITPLPQEAYPPFLSFSPSELRETPLEAGAHFVYEANTRYHFTADVVPDVVIYNLGRTRTCVFYQRFRYSPKQHQAFEALLASDARVPYAVVIGGESSFDGRIPSFAGVGTLHGAFAAEGATDCGPQPTRRF